MGKKPTENPRRHGKGLGVLLACLFVLAVGGGFLGGRYYLERAPRETTPVTRTPSQTRGTPAAPTLGGSDALPGATTTDNDAPIQVFFVPADNPASSPLKEALIALIGGARESVLCAFYDFELERVAEALIERHNAGVKVAVVSDSDYEDKPGVTRCRNAGIPVVFDGRHALMHNKFCVVDGQYVWTGSTNITRNCMFRNNNNAVLITSPELAVNFTNEFEEMFLHRQFGATSPQNTTHPTLTVAGIGLETYFAPEDGVAQAVIDRLAEAQQQIAFMTFVFTSVPIAEVMSARLAAGAQVRGVIERRSAGSRYSRHQYLNARGADIYIDTNPRTMHHKVIIVDARLVMTGSYNFSANAETRNDENLIMIHNPDIALLFLEELERIIASGAQREYRD